MKTKFRNLMLAIILIAASTTVHAQWWGLTGNNLTGTPKWLGTINGKDLIIKTYSSEVMRIKGNPTLSNYHYIGIGMNTSIPDPLNQFHIHNGAIRLTGTVPSYGGPQILFGGDAVNAVNGEWGLEYTTAVSPGGMNFWRPFGHTGTGGNYVLFLSNNSNVGINTSTPAEKLEVAGGDARINSITVGLGAGFIASNTALGYAALASNTSSGVNNTAVGYRALIGNTIGYYNTAIGTEALYTNISGWNNTATGGRALYLNITGGANTATGRGSLTSNSTGNNNTATGYSSLSGNMAGDDNTATGYGALSANIAGSRNTATGLEALNFNTTDNNTADGYRALYYNVAGKNNTASGYQSLYFTTGDYNTAVGHNALFYNAAGSNNTALGYSAGVGSGSTNLTNTVAIGTIATVSASNSMAIGANSTVSVLAGNSVVIGTNAIVNASNTIQLGGTTALIHSSGGYFVTSDGRFKDDIKESDAPGIDFINKLRPVSYKLDYKRYDDFLRKGIDASKNKTNDAYQQQLIEKSKHREIGFIAQEVEKIVKDNGYTFNGVYTPQNENDNYGIDYTKFIMPLVKSVQELSKENDDLKKQLLALSTRLEALENKSASSSQNNSQITIINVLIVCG